MRFLSVIVAIGCEHGDITKWTVVRFGNLGNTWTFNVITIDASYFGTNFFHFFCKFGLDRSIA